MKKNKIILIFTVILLHIMTFLDNSHSTEIEKIDNLYQSQNEAERLLLPYDIGNEENVRREDDLKKYIETCWKNNTRPYFRNPEEVMYAQQFGYIDQGTGKFIRKRSCCAVM